MPMLQEHQLRVAAIAGLIVDKCNLSVDKDRLEFALCFHDMGNIRKANFDNLPESIANQIPEGELEKWKKIKMDHGVLFGEEAHEATSNILKDMKVYPNVKDIIDVLEPPYDKDKLTDVIYKLALYADMRVAPQGVVALEERMSEILVRYGDEYFTHEMIDFIRNIETELFEDSDFTPTQVSDEAVSLRMEELRKKNCFFFCY